MAYSTVPMTVSGRKIKEAAALAKRMASSNGQPQSAKETRENMDVCSRGKDVQAVVPYSQRMTRSCCVCKFERDKRYLQCTYHNYYFTLGW